MLPPAEYDHPFEGALTVTVVKDIETVNKLCNNPKAGLGCAFTMNFGKVCSIIMACKRRQNVTPKELGDLNDAQAGIRDRAIEVRRLFGFMK